MIHHDNDEAAFRLGAQVAEELRTLVGDGLFTNVARSMLPNGSRPETGFVVGDHPASLVAFPTRPSGWLESIDDLARRLGAVLEPGRHLVGERVKCPATLGRR